MTTPAGTKGTDREGWWYLDGQWYPPELHPKAVIDEKRSSGDTSEFTVTSRVRTRTVRRKLLVPVVILVALAIVIDVIVGSRGSTPAPSRGRSSAAATLSEVNLLSQASYIHWRGENANVTQVSSANDSFELQALADGTVYGHAVGGIHVHAGSIYALAASATGEFAPRKLEVYITWFAGHGVVVSQVTSPVVVEGSEVRAVVSGPAPVGADFASVSVAIGGCVSGEVQKVASVTFGQIAKPLANLSSRPG